MENITQLWDCTKLLAKIKDPEVNELRNHYIQCCRELGDDVELPKQFFGYSTMCRHCGSLWNSIDHTVRISRGKNPSASIRKLIRSGEKNPLSLSKYQKQLIDKCKKNQTNKLLITCSNCKKRTKIKLNKKPREKPQKIIESAQGNGITPKNKKKKKNRDKSAGLLINTPKTPDVNLIGNTKKKFTFTPTASIINEKRKKSKATPVTSMKKINLSKLKGMINATITPSKKSSLHSFLTELG